jgi:hypothetical protein
MIPDMVKRSKVIMQAQQARGIETEGNIYLRMRASFHLLGLSSYLRSVNWKNGRSRWKFADFRRALRKRF